MFLDRDGVIIENRPDHVKTWSEVRFLDGAFERSGDWPPRRWRSSSFPIRGRGTRVA